MYIPLQWLLIMDRKHPLPQCVPAHGTMIYMYLAINQTHLN